MTAWLTTDQFATLANISSRAARLAINNALSARPWRGALLTVKRTTGQRGGKNGTAYLVHIASLPDDLKDALKGHSTPAQLALPLASPNQSPAAKARDWWHFQLNPLLVFPKGSSEREAAVSKLTSAPILDWQGRPKTLARSTVYAKLKALEEENSAAALMRKRRTDAGTKRTIFSLAWDKATEGKLPDAERHTIAEQMRQQIRARIAEGESRSRTVSYVSKLLLQTTVAHGVRTNDLPTLEAACRVPHDLYWAEKPKFNRVYLHKHDRKRSEDMMPYVSRHRPELPGDIYVLDVHHINVLVERENGKTGTVKMLGCYDWATGRITADFVFFEEAGGVRNVDNIEMIRRVFADPAWGVPGMLYVDNGSEYNFKTFLEHALQLQSEGFGYGVAQRKSQIIKALPYRGQSKPIENIHHQLNAHEFKHFQGFIGDDRMNQLRPAMGKTHKPFGSFEAFVERANQALADYNHHVLESGELKGLSPQMAFKRHVEGGWGAVVLDPNEFDGIFCKPETRSVTNHAIQVGGRIWTCRELDAYLGSQIVVKIPAYHGFNELRLEDLNGAFVGIACPDRTFQAVDTRGSKHSAARRATTRDAIKAAARSVPKVDIGATRAAMRQDILPVVANDPVGTLSISMDGPQAKAIVPMAAPKNKRELEAEERAQIAALRSRHAPRNKAS